MSRLVDPIHFFDARGRSVLTQDHLAAEVDRLAKENLMLKNRLKFILKRLKAAKEEKSEAVKS